MNNKPWAYVTSAWSADRSRAKRSAKRCCRKLYEAGYTPISVSYTHLDLLIRILSALLFHQSLFSFPAVLPQTSLQVQRLSLIHI